MKKIELGEYKVPSCHPEIRDLISKMLVISPDVRYSIEQVKNHPAFSLFLPENYILPSPISLPRYDRPINTDLIPKRIISILQQIGFKDENEVIGFLQSTGQNMSKIFYLMLIRFVSIKELPWKSREDSLNCDESANEYIITDILGDKCYSLAKNKDWNIGDSFHIDYSNEVLIENISLENTSLPTIWTSIQTNSEYVWFHPLDNAMIVKYDESNYLVILVQYIDASHVNIHMLPIGDQSDLFNSMIMQIRTFITNALT